MRAHHTPLLLVLLTGGCYEEELVDADGDGYFVNAINAADVDCDDGNAAIFPSNLEICDGLDNDCNSAIDDNPSGALEWYPDEDSDGYGARTDEPLIACSRPPNYSDNDNDCNDSDGEIFPNALERCNELDDNCNIQVDEGIDISANWYLDRDRDGYGGGEPVGEGCATDDDWVRTNTDCNDIVDTVRPGAAEICDGVDNDCDGLVDGEDEDITGARTYYVDADQDGYGNLLGGIVSCTRPEGFVDNADDCNDFDDDQGPPTTWYLDEDRDGDGTATETWPVQQCWQPIGYSVNTYDCDDSDPTSSGVTPWYADADRDGYGAPLIVSWGCVGLPGWVRNDEDCDDRDETLRPGQPEICDGIDNNCDGLTDAEDPNADGVSIWYPDFDEDGWGINFDPLLSCDPIPGRADQLGDCNDSNPELNPGTEWWVDADRDGFGDPSQPYGAASCEVIPGHATNGDDCDDTDFGVSPSNLWYTDNDGDGLGVGMEPAAVGCVTDTTGLSLETGDCDDDDALNNEGGCFGPQIGRVLLEIQPDADATFNQVKLTCQGLGQLIFKVISPQEIGTTIQEFADVDTGTMCELEVFGAADASNDGGTLVDIQLCGTSLEVVESSPGAWIDRRFAVDVSCAGCTDPLASNYDSEVLIDNGACLFD